MEDPWSSPWATDDAPSHDNNSTFAESSLDVPEPRIVTTLPNHNESVTITTSTNSPWKAEDDWGGWTGDAQVDDNHEWKQEKKQEKHTTTIHIDPWAQVDEQAINQSKIEADVIFPEKPTDSAISLGSKPESLEDDDSPPTPSNAKANATPETDSSRISLNSIQNDEDTHNIGTTSPAASTTLTAEDQVEQRKSSKVQELVEMYDGMAKKLRSVSAANAEAKDSLSLPITQRAEDGIQMLNEDCSDADKDEASSSSTSEEVTVCVDVGDEEEEDSGSQRTSTTATVEDNQDEDLAESTISGEPYKGPRSIPFPIDLRKLDILFPSVASTSVQPEPVPDTIIDDTFTTISQRKLWYRISRFGSQRKHDQGNDEYYRPVNWQTSEVRNKTTQIARRWMEEDSITGRVVLGKKTGPIGASLFNWDSTGPAIEISELLRTKRTAGGHVRNQSLPPPEIPSTPQTETAPDFGWTASVPSTPAIPNISKDSDNVGLKRPETVPALAPSFPISPWEEQSAAPIATAPVSAAPTIPTKLRNNPITIQNSVETQKEIEQAESGDDNDDDNDDDDDWGDMMTVEDTSDFPSLSRPSSTASTADHNTPTISLKSKDDAPWLENTEIPLSNSDNTISQLLTSSISGDMGSFDTLASSSSMKKATKVVEETAPMNEFPKPIISTPIYSNSLAWEMDQPISHALSHTEAPSEEIYQMIQAIPDLSYMLR